MDSLAVETPKREAMRKRMRAIGLGRSAVIAGVAVTRITRVLDGRHVDSYILGSAAEGIGEGDALNHLRRLEQDREVRS
jgi:hypothetical protein